MVGNDIVDLADVDADAATYSPRWLERVCTPHERSAVAAAADRHRMRWRIWAAKEATYKWAGQLDPTTVFSPRSFGVTLDAGARLVREGRRCGHVDWQGERIPLFLEEGESYVHAWVDDAPSHPEPLRRGLASVPEALASEPDGPSRHVRCCVVRDAQMRFGRAPGLLRISRTGRIPHLVGDHGRVSASLSLSHHGRFVAFAWRPAPGMGSRDASDASPYQDMNGALA